MRRNGLWKAAAGLSLAIALAACKPAGESDSTPIVARVGEREIRLSEVQRWLSERPGAQRRAARPGGASAELEALIERIVVEQEAQQLGLDGADAERQSPEILRSLLLERFASTIQVPEAEVRARFDATQGQRITSRIHLRQIVVADESAARSVQARIAAGQDFAALAAEVSAVPELRDRRGDLGPMLRDDVPAEIGTAAFSLTEPLQVSESFPIGERWSVLQLVSREPAVPVPFESARAEIERELRQELAAAELERALQARRDELGVEIDETQLAALGPPAVRSLGERAKRAPE